MITNKHILTIAHKHGFDLVGFAKAGKLTHEIDHLNEWLKRGYQSNMLYMERNTDKREDVSLILPDVKSVISLAMNYYTDHQHENKPGHGKVSRYAWGKDYHFIIWEKLEYIIDEIKEIDKSFEAKAYVDTGPVMDKAWAVRAGLGWLGKHTNVISREIGSYFFIANIITNKEFEYNEPVTDFCGSCTACIDACPTNAIVDEYIVDANKCISYLTIENKGEIPSEFEGKFNNWLFGCDVCQEVCPWNNKFAEETTEREFYPKDNDELSFEEIEGMSNSKFKRRFGTSPISRARLKGLKRNARFIKE
ncbi:MAG: tRNA epoxyqueuosine(34) reductase QueG [Melioribacteraceae bacterium]|nr:tRNA epoxyqueuosine(34) reductase QueG [Melioribacteraceae bacterium]MCF8357046.1 tRNA epoxyqueuosine(34) reductase QueG [Melioribacteraceae bacterium]MCF8396507.1 tRNA epoxyqueuosine(34) reductase QueG [Melioribacteraceae bacterium]